MTPFPRARTLRAAVVGGLLAAVSLAAVVPSAGAAPQDWAGSEILTTSSSNATVPIQAAFRRTSWGENPRLLARTTVTSPPGQPDGCGLAEPAPPTNVHFDGSQYLTEAVLTTSCNGTYGVTITAYLQNRTCFGSLCNDYRTVDSYELTGTLQVAAAAPDVDAHAEPGAGRSVTITWDEPGGLPPDFLGYRVQRQSSTGAWATIATLDAPDAPTSYTDGEPPAAGGDIRYRVLSRRSGPDGEVTSSGGSTATATVKPSADGSGAPTGDGDGTSGDPATDGAGSSDSGGPDAGNGASGAGGGAAGRPGGSAAAPRVGLTGIFLPPRLQPRVPTVAAATTPTTVDDGFEDSLPYEVSDEEPVLPDGEMASIVTSETPGRGMAIPIATGLVLAVWALHLRALARAARPS